MRSLTKKMLSVISGRKVARRCGNKICQVWGQEMFYNTTEWISVEFMNPEILVTVIPKWQMYFSLNHRLIVTANKRLMQFSRERLFISTIFGTLHREDASLSFSKTCHWWLTTLEWGALFLCGCIIGIYNQNVTLKVQVKHSTIFMYVWNTGWRCGMRGIANIVLKN